MRYWYETRNAPQAQVLPCYVKLSTPHCMVVLTPLFKNLHRTMYKHIQLPVDSKDCQNGIPPDIGVPVL